MRGIHVDPWSPGEIPARKEQLSPCATATGARVSQLLEPVCLERVFCQGRSEACAPQRRGALVALLEKAGQQQGPALQKPSEK